MKSPSKQLPKMYRCDVTVSLKGKCACDTPYSHFIHLKEPVKCGGLWHRPFSKFLIQKGQGDSPSAKMNSSIQPGVLQTYSSFSH